MPLAWTLPLQMPDVWLDRRKTMITNDIRQAAGLLRAAWWQNDFCQGEAVCVMGSIAKVYLPV